MVLAGRPLGSCKRSAWKRTFLIRMLSEAMTPSPHPSTSCLRPLNPTTSHNNNNGGLHVCVRPAEDIEPFLQLTHLVVECESQQQFDLINGPHKQFWFPRTSHFRLLLVVFGFSVHCLFTVRKIYARAPSLLPRFWWISSATYRPGLWTTMFFGHFQWILMDANIVETMSRDTDEKKGCFRACGRALRLLSTGT